MKQTVLLAGLFISFSAGCQYFDWVASGNFIDPQIEFTSMDSQKNIVVGGEFRRTNEIKTGQELWVDGTGKSTDIPLYYSHLHYHNSWYHVVSTSADGALKWHMEIQKGNAELLGISHDDKGNVLLLVHVEGQFTESGEDGETEDDETYGWFPELYPSEEEAEFWKAGYYVVQLSSSGKFISRKQVFEGKMDLDMEVEGFRSYVGNGFLVQALVDRKFEYPAFKKDPASCGGHAVFAFDSEGKELWSDLIRYSCNNSWSYRYMTNSPDGNVYIAGNVNEEAFFSNEQSIKAHTSENRSMNWQGYLLAYSPQGKIRWLKSSETNVIINQLKATNEQVFLNYKLLPGQTTAFGFKNDTTGLKTLVTASFTPAGKKLWNISENGTRAHSLEVKDHIVYVYAQQPLHRYFEKVGDAKVLRLEYSYLSTYTINGQFIGSKVYPLDVEEDEVNAFLFPVSEKEIYLVANFREGFQKKLTEIDVKFGNLTGYGSAGLIGRLK